MTPMQLNPLTSANLDHPSFEHGFFTREGGVSTGIYKGLNCGLGSNDAPDAVEQNRQLVREALGASAILTVHQVHSPDVVTVDAPFPGAPPKADAMVTRTKGIALGALAADCAPVLFADADAGVIGAAHAGWRGALSGVTDQVIAAMEALGTARSSIKASIGPAISVRNYEVGPDFVATLLDVAPGNSIYFQPAEREGHVMFDLPRYVSDRLKSAGVEHVENLDACTYADPDRFFSYRRSCHRNEPDYGRLVSAIALKDD
ncbi:MAG: peptidoglycan editing factor PgeF [Pseudomonadota bacterium]